MNFLKEKKKFFLLIIIFLLFLTPLFLFAQDIPLEVAYPELGGEDPSAAGGEEGLTSYINYIYSFLFFVAAIILFGVLIYGGFLYLTAGANASKTKRARSFLVSGLIGVVLVFSSHLVLRTINPQITKIDLEKLNPIGEEGPVAGEPDVEKSDSKALALPVDKGIEELIGKDTHLPRTKKLITEDLRNHITATFTVDKDIAGQETREGIASFAKYNHFLATKCSCQNLEGQCGPPGHGSYCSSPDGGGTCKATEGFEDEDGNPDPCPEDVRKEMNKKIVDLGNYINNDGSFEAEHNQYEASLEDLNQKIKEERKLLNEKISQFETLEYNLTAADWKNSIDTRNQFLSRVDKMLNPQKKDEEGTTKYESEREVLEIIPSSISDSKFSNLTFYEIIHSEVTPSFRKEKATEVLPSKIRRDQKIILTKKIKLGELMDKVRENTIALSGKMEKLNNLLNELQGKLSTVIEGVSDCNDSNCSVQCNCLPNPWLAINPSAPPCLNCVGGCGGLACSGAKSTLSTTTEEIDEIENEIIKTIDEFEMLATTTPFYLANKEDSSFETINLHDVKAEATDCISQKGKDLISCESALGHTLKPENDLIVQNCHPRDYYCADIKRVESLEEQNFTELYNPNLFSDYSTSSENCPDGWECSSAIEDNKQIEDASEPLQRFLNCFRNQLDKKRKENEIEDKTIASINEITDTNLYKENKNCSWETGGEDCKHDFQMELFKERVSPLYGGERCRYLEESYGVQLEYEPRYLDLLIKSANECLDSSNINLNPPYLNISIAGAYRCGVK